MAYNQLLSVSVYRYKDGKTRPSLWVSRFNRRAWEDAGKNTPALDHIRSHRYTWNARNLRRLRAFIPASWQVADTSLIDVWRSTWRIPPTEPIIGTDW